MTKTFWDVSEPGTPETGVRNLPSAEGELLGKEIARLALPCIERFKATFPDEPPPCGECAFVAGALGNRTVSSTMDALKCLMEGVPFYCHKGDDGNGDPKRVCAGWLASRVDLEVREATSLLTEAVKVTK